VKAAVTAEQLKQLLGVDVAAAVQNLAAPRQAAALPAVPAPVRPKPPTLPGTGNG
jgi:hypothetical protein